MPNRIIKESICSSDEIEMLTDKEEILFYRLIVQCDDYGTFDARPAIIRAKCFPLRTERVKESDIEKWIIGLVKARLIDLYEIDGKRYLIMLSWEKHQQRRAKHGKYPLPQEDDIIGYHMISSDSKCSYIRESRIENRESRIENREAETHTHGSQNNVRLTDDELSKLKEEFPDLIQDGIELLSLWLAEKGDKAKSKSHNLTIRRWVIDAVKEKRAKTTTKNKPSYKPNNIGNFEQREYRPGDLDDVYEEVTIS